MLMKPIRLPEPPGSPTKSVPDIFEAGAYSVIRRAVIIGNGYEASENQSIGLVQALGLSEKRVLYVISRRSGDKLLPFHTENGGSAGLSSVIEADVKSIVSMARVTSEDGPLLVVACGKDTSSIASSIKKLASDNVFVVQISKSWSYPPLNDTAEAANRVREAIAERGWSLRP